MAFSRRQATWQSLSDEERPHQRSGESPDQPLDADLLDAYSRAVIAVVEQVGPAVVGLLGTGRDQAGGQGSGFVVAADGLALTNSHVVAGRRQLLVATGEGDRLPAEIQRAYRGGAARQQEHS